MEHEQIRCERTKLFFLRKRLVLLLLITLLIGLNIFVIHNVSYVFTPFVILMKTIVLPLILSGIAFYLLNPIINQLEKYKISRTWGILIVYLAIVGFIAIVVMKISPILQNQITGLINNFPSLSDRFFSKFEKWFNSSILSQLQVTGDFYSQKTLDTLTTEAGKFLDSIFTGVLGVIGTIGSFVEKIISIITVPFILFYLLKDGRKLPDKILSFLPINLRSRFMNVLVDINHQISSFIRGQIFISFCIGLMLYLGYIIIGLDYPLALAIFASLTNVVPYIGPAIAIIPALIVALVTSPIMLLKMIIVWTVVQLTEGKFISPQIMGRTLQIHPITIIFVILTAGNLFGITGVLFAVPGYAVIKVCVTHAFESFKDRSGLYNS
ncbi:AI-2E family transporter [Paenibacillus sp. 7523-1]|uniref:AI-2E family transporter n=1 Tax=Paenibacillus sp. 7523-1 TaxID=2022550 RepID=UPI000BA5CC14|nr:AI-2E family transporter [Paenibacillus sp. 7523-1]PAD28713.1 AI-2E family transporter [Paenibacillus sp. 7523-1]